MSNTFEHSKKPLSLVKQCLNADTSLVSEILEGKDSFQLLRMWYELHVEKTTSTPSGKKLLAQLGEHLRWVKLEGRDFSDWAKMAASLKNMGMDQGRKLTTTHGLCIDRYLIDAGDKINVASIISGMENLASLTLQNMVVVNIKDECFSKGLGGIALPKLKILEVYSVLFGIFLQETKIDGSLSLKRPHGFTLIPVKSQLEEIAVARTPATFKQIYGEEDASHLEIIHHTSHHWVEPLGMMYKSILRADPSQLQQLKTLCFYDVGHVVPNNKGKHPFRVFLEKLVSDKNLHTLFVTITTLQIFFVEVDEDIVHILELLRGNFKNLKTFAFNARWIELDTPAFWAKHPNHASTTPILETIKAFPYLQQILLDAAGNDKDWRHWDQIHQATRPGQFVQIRVANAVLEACTLQYDEYLSSHRIKQSRIRFVTYEEYPHYFPFISPRTDPFHVPSQGQDKPLSWKDKILDSGPQSPPEAALPLIGRTSTNSSTLSQTSTGPLPELTPETRFGSLTRRFRSRFHS
ncbi:hypothetical protein T439DRAFT_347878 [Meredithblackwellia eburnea MCA 4105]